MLVRNYFHLMARILTDTSLFLFLNRPFAEYERINLEKTKKEKEITGQRMGVLEKKAVTLESK